MITSRAWQLARDHCFFALILGVIFISRFPYVANLEAVILLNQDFNPEHFGHLFFDNDIPSVDDSEAGENARTFSLTSIYYWLPLLAYQIGVPFQFFSGFHALFVLPTLALGVYRLALALFNNPKIACLAVLIFLFKDFALFRLNLGYPILLNSTIYHSDPAYIFVIFSLLAMLEKRLILVALWIGVLVLLNPTWAVTLTACFGLHLLFQGHFWSPKRSIFISFSIIGLAAFVVYMFVTAATPITNPVPELTRDLAIRGNSHLNPHISMPTVFLMAQLVIIFGLIFALSVEHRLAKGSAPSKQRACARNLGFAMVAGYLIFGWISYWFLYVTAPKLLVVIAPAKFFIIIAIYLIPYVAFALYLIWKRIAMSVVIVLALAVFVLNPTSIAHVRDARMVAAVLVPFLLLALFAIWITFRFQGASVPDLRVKWWLLIAVFLIDFLQTTTKIFRTGEIEAAKAFHQIQLEIHSTVVANAVFVPYRYAGVTGNHFGPFRNWAFRTYSRRGGLVFWAFGRSIYFNTILRQDTEEACYAAFGIELWGSLLRESELALRRDPLYYYTGIRFDGLMPHLDPTPIWKILIKPYEDMKEKISAMSLEEFKRSAAIMGATHIIVSRAPGIGQELHGLVENEYFVVVPVR